MASSSRERVLGLLSPWGCTQPWALLACAPGAGRRARAGPRSGGDTACVQSSPVLVLFPTADTVTATRGPNGTVPADVPGPPGAEQGAPGRSPTLLSALLTGVLRHTRHSPGQSPGLRGAL